MWHGCCHPCWLQPDSNKGWSQWFPHLERLHRPGSASSRRGNSEDTDQDLCLPDECFSLEVLHIHGVSFLQSLIFPEMLSSCRAALKPQPCAALKGREQRVLECPGHCQHLRQSYAKERENFPNGLHRNSPTEEKQCGSGSSEPRSCQLLMLLKQFPLKFTLKNFIMKFYGSKWDYSYSKMLNKIKTKQNNPPSKYTYSWNASSKE